MSELSASTLKRLWRGGRQMPGKKPRALTSDRVREQLQLWDTRPRAKPTRPPKPGESWRRRLQHLLREDLSFEGQDTSYSRHNFHAFAAKFPPQLPQFFIDHLTTEGETVLDPMMGSGTAVLEAALARRNGIGFDIDPLAVRICQIKTMPLARERVESACHQAAASARRLLLDEARLRRHLDERFDAQTKAFVDYWFLPSTQLELQALTESISEVEEPGVRAFLEIAFSASIVTKSGGVSLAMDLAHSRPHKVSSKVPRHAIDQFEQRVRKSLKGLAEPLPKGLVGVERADARSLPLSDHTVDLIVTSPPYANAIDYVRAHKFSLVWLGESIGQLSELRSSYVGSEKASGEPLKEYGPISASVLSELSRRDEKKRRVLSRYLRDMSAIFAEMLRVLRPGRCAVVVVGSSTMRGLDVQTDRCLAEVCSRLGWHVVGIAARRIDRDKRMMPMRRSAKAESQIEQRMSVESVIGMLKPSGISRLLKVGNSLCTANCQNLYSCESFLS